MVAPNVVLIIMDDLAYGDLACLGNPYVRTPNLDRMHANGVRFTQASSGLVCTPARAMLMTGRYAYRTRAIDTYNGRTTIDPDEVTLAEVLRDAGYATGLSGKWHLGDNYPSRPQDLGFEEVLMHNGGGLRQPGNDGFWDGWDSYQDPYLMHNGKGTRHEGFCTDVFTDHAIDFMRQQVKAKRPFFSYVATNAPHSPFEDVPDAWAQRFLDAGLNDTFARLYAMVENIDKNVGRIQHAIDDLGIRENTIVIYTSDHGPCGSAMHDGESRFNAGLRGMKGTPYQGGVRVPCFWEWPDQIEQGRDIDRIIAPIDVLPTLTSLCGGRLPSDRKIDGVDLSPLLLDAKAEDRWPDRTLHLQWHRGDRPRPFNGTMSRNQRYKLVDGRELYDIQNDPGETRDIAADHPDQLAELRNAYETWFDDVSQTRPGNFEPVLIKIGTPHETPTVLNRNDRRSHGPDSWAQDEEHGHWAVSFQGCSGRYDVSIDFLPRDTPGQATLATGGQCWTLPVAAGEAQATFANLEIPTSETRLEAWVSAGHTSVAARYVRVTGV
ncbi:MAG: arylsulfatase [Planctomycetota bacterium]